MHVGMTYDLRDEYLAEGHDEEATAEFDRADTIDAIAAGLLELGHQVDRIGRVRQLVARLAAGDRWDLVFNICEGLRGMAREAQVPAILEVYDIAYTFGDPLVMALCLHKGLAKMVVERAGLPTPKSLLVESAADLDLLPDHLTLPFPLFAKPVGEGTGKGITPASRITTRAELLAVCRQLLEQFRQPVLVEEFLPGREFTVGLLGTGSRAAVLGTLEIILRRDAEPDVYSYVNKERCEELVEYRLVRPDDPQVRMAEQTALAAWRALGGRDGGRLDLRCDARGVPQFMEANPLAGMHPSHSDLPMLATAVGMPYVELIRRIVESARERVARV
ncbi:MAG: D-alanine--D-alanine ligase [Planctomycetaceae bacterium]|nr:D-alanine--D-alanine ligase [Planctomycetaceae bacterium]